MSPHTGGIFELEAWVTCFGVVTYPMWDEERNNHLFTAKALEEPGELLELVTDHNMEMVLLKDILTLEAKSTKNWTHPDNDFCSINTVDMIVS